MDYTLYFVNPIMGYFERSLTFAALNDEVAARIAQRRAGLQPLELWCGGRLVQRYETEAASAAPDLAEAAA